MKFNLKNRPKVCFQPAKNGTMSLSHIESWFEGFEKELRDMIEKYSAKDAIWGKELIEEILGDTSN